MRKNPILRVISQRKKLYFVIAPMGGDNLFKQTPQGSNGGLVTMSVAKEFEQAWFLIVFRMTLQTMTACNVPASRGEIHFPSLRHDEVVQHE